MSKKPDAINTWSGPLDSESQESIHSDCVGMAGEGLHRVTLQWAQLLLVQNSCPQTLLWCPKDTHGILSLAGLCSVGTACDAYKPDTHIRCNSFSPVEVTTDYYVL